MAQMEAVGKREMRKKMGREGMKTENKMGKM